MSRQLRLLSSGRLAALLALALVPGPAPVVLAAERPAAAAGREMATDRPDSTESPFTLEAGRMQLEADVASVMEDRQDGVRTTEWVVAPFNLRFGLTSSVEAGIFVVPHVRLTEQGRGGPRTTVRGIGDTTLRLKWNGAGNDGGGPGWGFIADLKLPTAADGLGNDRVDGALTLPVAIELGGGWEAAGMTGVEWVHTGAKREAIWINTMTVGRELWPETGGFIELTSAAGSGRHVATLNFGLTRQLGPDLKLDLGVNLGVSRTAPDRVFFAGFARRF